MSPVQAVARRLVAPLAPAHRRPPPAHLRVVDEPPTRTSRGFGRRSPLVGAFVFVGLLAVAAAHAYLVQGQIALDALDEAVAAQQEDYYRARLEVARLEAPERIVNDAIIRLGMVEPADVVYLTPSIAATDVERPTSDDVDETWLDIKPYLERSS